MAGVEAHTCRVLRGHPSSTVQIDCVLDHNLPPFSGLWVGQKIKKPADAGVNSPVRPAGRGRCSVLTTNGKF
jgi:hypothetical protein